MIKKVKALRVQIDGLAQLTEDLGADDHVIAGRTMKAVDSLYLGKAWLGKVLGALGEDSPYVSDGKRETVENIEPAADKSPVWRFAMRGDTVIIVDRQGEEWKQDHKFDINHIQKVDLLRQEIQKIVVDNTLVWGVENSQGRVAMDSLRAEQHLSEARFWLGFVLERIRENGNA